MHRSPNAARPFGSSSRAAQHQAAPKRPRLDDDTPRRAALAGNEQRSAAITDDGGSPSSVCHFDAVVVAPRATRKVDSEGAAPPRCGSALTGVKSPFRHIQLEARRAEHEAAFEAARGDGPRRQEALGAAHRDGVRLMRARMCLASIEEGRRMGLPSAPAAERARGAAADGGVDALLGLPSGAGRERGAAIGGDATVDVASDDVAGGALGGDANPEGGDAPVALTAAERARAAAADGGVEALLGLPWGAGRERGAAIGVDAADDRDADEHERDAALTTIVRRVAATGGTLNAALFACAGLLLPPTRVTIGAERRARQHGAIAGAFGRGVTTSAVATRVAHLRAMLPKLDEAYEAADNYVLAVKGHGAQLTGSPIRARTQRYYILGKLMLRGDISAATAKRWLIRSVDPGVGCVRSHFATWLSGSSPRVDAARVALHGLLRAAARGGPPYERYSAAIDDLARRYRVPGALPPHGLCSVRIHRHASLEESRCARAAFALNRAESGVGELTARDLLSCPVVPLRDALRRLLAGGVLLMQLPRKVETVNALVDLWAARTGVDRALVRSELEPPRWTLGPRRLELAWRGDGTTRGPLLLRVLAMTRRLITSSVVAAAPNIVELLRRHADGFELGGIVWLRDADAADAVALLRRSLPRRADTARLARAGAIATGATRRDWCRALREREAHGELHRGELAVSETARATGGESAAAAGPVFDAVAQRLARERARRALRDEVAAADTAARRRAAVRVADAGHASRLLHIAFAALSRRRSGAVAAGIAALLRSTSPWKDATIAALAAEPGSLLVRLRCVVAFGRQRLCSAPGAATGPALDDDDDDDEVAISPMSIDGVALDGVALDGVALAPTLGVNAVGAFAGLARDLVAKANAEEARAAADQMRAAQQVAVVLASAAACEGSLPALEDGEVNDVVPAITSAASELSAARLAASDAAAASTSETAAMLRGALVEMSPSGATHETTVETTARDMIAAVRLPRECELRAMQHRAVAAVALRGANIILVDPPASGKSVVGFALAARGDALWITGT